MKQIILFFTVISLLGITSCTSSVKEKAEDKTESQSKRNACDEFLEQYEEWADEYFMALEEYANNPSDEEVILHCTQLMQQAMEWSTKWIDLVECANDEEYEQRFKEISKEVEDKLNELNL